MLWFVFLGREILIGKLVAGILLTVSAGGVSAAALDPAFSVTGSMDNYCGGSHCVFGVEHWWGYGGDQATLTRSGGGDFLFSSAAVDGSIMGYMMSGSSPSPAINWPNGSVHSLPDWAQRIDAYQNWVHAGGAPDFPVFYMQGMRGDNLVFDFDFGPDAYSGESYLGYSGTVSTSFSFGKPARVDKLVFGFNFPDNYDAASFFDAGPLLESNSLNCWYGCGAVLEVRDLDVAPVPIPASALLLGSALGGIGGLSWRRKRRMTA